MEIKTKINKKDLIKLKRFHGKGNYKQGKNNTLGKWEKIIANETTEKGIISKI